MILDPNLMFGNEEAREDTVWYGAETSPFCLYGFDRGENDLFSCRIPEEIARNINEGVYNMRAYSAGGRIRFGTDSPYILIRAEFAEGRVSRISSYCFSYGFDLYTCDSDGKETFCNTFRVPMEFDDKAFTSAYDVYDSSGFRYYTLT